MDNVTHTLAGALLAECGLKERSRLAYPALLIGANLPDIDAFTYALGDSVDALVVRRGWTHGVLAMAVLPFLVAAILMGWEAMRRRRADPRALADRRRPEFGALVAVSAVAILSHPLLDLLNNYGVRLLMPFSDRWFYGDMAFIIDPWMLLLLFAGILLARRPRRRSGGGRTWARAALVLLLAYIGVLGWVSAGSARALARAAGKAGPVSPRTLMVVPEPMRLTSRTGLVDVGDAYEGWRLAWRPWGTQATLTGERITKGADDPRAQRARASADGRRFLSWSRFPYFVSGVGGAADVVHIGDARYTRGTAPSWAAVQVRLGTPQ